MQKVMGYCVKCRDKAGREMVNPSLVEIKPGRFAAKGKCAVCDTGMYKILSAADADKMRKG